MPSQQLNDALRVAGASGGCAGRRGSHRHACGAIWRGGRRPAPAAVSAIPKPASCRRPSRRRKPSRALRRPPSTAGPRRAASPRRRTVALPQPCAGASRPSAERSDRESPSAVLRAASDAPSRGSRRRVPPGSGPRASRAQSRAAGPRNPDPRVPAARTRSSHARSRSVRRRRAAIHASGLNQ